MIIKKPQTVSKSSAKTAKSSAKKNIPDSTKRVKKSEIKKPAKAVKTPATKLSRPKTASKPAGAKAGPEIKKPLKATAVKNPAKGSFAAKKPDKTSIAIAKGKKAQPKESLKTVKPGKSITSGNKPLKKSPAKIVTAKSKLTQEKTLKPVATKRPAVRKVSKVATGKKEVKTPAKAVSIAKKEKNNTAKKVKTALSKVTQAVTAKPVVTKKPSASKVSKVAASKKEVKTPAKAASIAKKEKNNTAKKVKTALPKVTQAVTAKPIVTKKPSASKVSKVVAKETEGTTTKELMPPVKIVSAAINEKKRILKKVKTGLQKKSKTSSAAEQIKETVKKETVLKPKKKTETAIVATSIKSIKKKLTPPLITPEPPTSIIEEKAAAHIAVAKAEPKPRKVAKLKVFLPVEELLPEETQKQPSPRLPQEYGENELLLMEVDPLIVFVSWEIRPDDISSETGRLVLRVYDVTGIDFDGTNANRFFDISLKNRADSKFFDIKMPGKDVIMEIGLLHPDSTFKAIKQSNRVSIPELQILDEFGITGSSSDTETLIGY